MIISTTIRAASHADDVTWLRHLVINLPKSRRHLVGHGACDNNNVDLSRRSAPHATKTVDVVPRANRLHHFNGAAGKSKGQWVEGALSGPVGDLIDGCPRYHVRVSSVHVSRALHSGTTNSTYSTVLDGVLWLGSGTSFQIFPLAVGEFGDRGGRLGICLAILGLFENHRGPLRTMNPLAFLCMILLRVLTCLSEP